jgi:hypothetical protein
MCQTSQWYLGKSGMRLWTDVQMWIVHANTDKWNE